MQPLPVAILGTIALTMSASVLPALAQGVTIPGKPSGTPAATTVGPVSPQASYSEGGCGSTAAGAGKATSENSSEYPDRN